MTALLQLGDVRIEMVRKPIRNLHLSVYPPDGRVRISAPERATVEAVRLFAIKRLGWIRRQQKKLRTQERESPREYLPRESHYVWGRRHLLIVIERDSAPAIELTPRRLRLHIRPGTEPQRRGELLESWYREQLRLALPPLLGAWEKRLGVHPNHIYVQRMKTRWGGCNHASRNLRLNTELAKKPIECLEYILVHELAHLREPTHNAHFMALLDQWMPQWRERRNLLNRLPVRYED